LRTIESKLPLLPSFPSINDDTFSPHLGLILRGLSQKSRVPPPPLSPFFPPDAGKSEVSVEGGVDSPPIYPPSAEIAQGLRGPFFFFPLSLVDYVNGCLNALFCFLEPTSPSVCHAKVCRSFFFFFPPQTTQSFFPVLPPFFFPRPCQVFLAKSSKARSSKCPFFSPPFLWSSRATKSIDLPVSPFFFFFFSSEPPRLFFVAGGGGVATVPSFFPGQGFFFFFCSFPVLSFFLRLLFSPPARPHTTQIWRLVFFLFFFPPSELVLSPPPPPASPSPRLCLGAHPQGEGEVFPLPSSLKRNRRTVQQSRPWISFFFPPHFVGLGHRRVLFPLPSLSPFSWPEEEE